jgi:hypothetical protein
MIVPAVMGMSNKVVARIKARIIEKASRNHLLLKLYGGCVLSVIVEPPRIKQKSKIYRRLKNQARPINAMTKIDRLITANIVVGRAGVSTGLFVVEVG